MKTIKERLEAGKAKIEDPANWWDGSGSKEGQCASNVLFCDPEAKKALAKAIGWHTGKNLIDIIAGFNDTHSHKDVMAMFDKAIANEA